MRWVRAGAWAVAVMAERDRQGGATWRGPRPFTLCYILTRREGGGSEGPRSSFHVVGGAANRTDDWPGNRGPPPYWTRTSGIRIRAMPLSRIAEGKNSI